ncbi:MAG: hypothetical protein QOJ83_2055 [Frankiales bacterium]|nr:hypothetical protein [Frankiales bacterium]
MSNRKKLKRPKDQSLPFLDVDEAGRVRALMRETLAERGLEVTVFDDHLKADDGREFGLWNVAAKCHAAGRSEATWRRVVVEHVDKLMANVAAGDPFEGLSQDEVLARTYTRLWERSSLPGGAEHYPHVEFAPGLLEVISLALPHGVATFNRDRVEQFGGWDLLRARGRANLSQHAPDTVDQVITREGATFFVAGGESIYTASLSLLMPHFSAPVDGPADTGLGWLLSVPNRHELCWHFIRDADDAISALVAMTVYTPTAHGDSPGPLSPHVFWWSGEGYRQLTGYVEDGRITCFLDKDFERALETVLDGRPG